MLRSFIIMFILFGSTIASSQTMTFDKAIDNLYFGVDITKVSGFLVDTFLTMNDLHHNDIVTRQSNLGVSMQLQSDKQAWSDRHTFTFTKSPLRDLKIKSGIIRLTIAELDDTKKLLDLQWSVDFNTKNDAELYFEQLAKIFKPLSTKHKTELDKNVGQIAQYSTRKPGDKGIRDISLVLGQSLKTKDYQISLLLMNEFMTD